MISCDLIDFVQKFVPGFHNSIKNNETFDGSLLSNSFYSSIFSEKETDLFPLLPSDHVGNKQGTGLVHIAPALGQDDFKIGIRHGLTTDCVIGYRIYFSILFV